MLKLQSCLITGASRGIGKELAIFMKEKGYKVTTLNRTISWHHKSINQIKLDITNWEEINKLDANFDLIINNAATHIKKGLRDITIDEWQQDINTNLNGMFYICKKFIPNMMLRNFGRVVNIGSRIFEKPTSDHIAYSTSKLAVIGLTKCLAEEVKNFNIKINCLCPGSCQTSMNPYSLKNPNEVCGNIYSLLTLQKNGFSGRFIKC